MSDINRQNQEYFKTSRMSGDKDDDSTIEDALDRCDLGLQDEVRLKLTNYLKGRGAKKASDLRFLSRDQLEGFDLLKEIEILKLMEEVDLQCQRKVEGEYTKDSEPKNANVPFKVFERANELKFVNDQVKMHQQAKVEELKLDIEKTKLLQKLQNTEVNHLQLSVQVDKQRLEHEQAVAKQQLEVLAAHVSAEETRSKAQERKFDSIKIHSNLSGFKLNVMAVLLGAILAAVAWKVENPLPILIMLFIHGLIVLGCNASVHWIDIQNVAHVVRNMSEDKEKKKDC